MGFPDVTEVLGFETKKRVLISAVYVLGLILFCYLLNPVLNLQVYENNVYLP